MTGLHSWATNPTQLHQAIQKLAKQRIRGMVIPQSQLPDKRNSALAQHLTELQLLTGQCLWVPLKTSGHLSGTRTADKNCPSSPAPQQLGSRQGTLYRQSEESANDWEASFFPISQSRAMGVRPWLSAASSGWNGQLQHTPDTRIHIVDGSAIKLWESKTPSMKTAFYPLKTSSLRLIFATTPLRHVVANMEHTWKDTKVILETFWIVSGTDTYRVRHKQRKYTSLRTSLKDQME